MQLHKFIKQLGKAVLSLNKLQNCFYFWFFFFNSKKHNGWYEKLEVFQKLNRKLSIFEFEHLRSKTMRILYISLIL
jgi:hypothetical protein